MVLAFEKQTLKWAPSPNEKHKPILAMGAYPMGMVKQAHIFKTLNIVGVKSQTLKKYAPVGSPEKSSCSTFFP